MATLTELIRQEDPKRPYTDEQLAQMLQLRREQVVELRRINGIPNSWMRLRPATCARGCPPLPLRRSLRSATAPP